MNANEIISTAKNKEVLKEFYVGPIFGVHYDGTCYQLSVSKPDNTLFIAEQANSST